MNIVPISKVKTPVISFSAMDNYLSALMIVKNLTPEEKVELVRVMCGIEIYHCTSCEKMFHEQDMEYDYCLNCDLGMCKTCASKVRINWCKTCLMFFCLKCSELMMMDNKVCIDCNSKEKESEKELA